MGAEKTATPTSTSIRAINRSRGTVLCERLETADGVAGRGRGLVGRAGLEAGAGMLFDAGWLQPFMWMHMFFMRFPIDIVFLDASGRVIKIDHRLKPWRLSSLAIGARRAIELAAGAAVASRTERGDLIEIALGEIARS
jgi:uncharacterized protein